MQKEGRKASTLNEENGVDGGEDGTKIDNVIGLQVIGKAEERAGRRHTGCMGCHYQDPLLV